MTNPIVVIETNMGTIKAELFMDKAPITAGNFIKLAKSGYYDGIIFHRVIDGFMLQAGDPTGTGRGGPGYTIKDEFHPALRHDREGTFSMANTGMPDTGGSQFFITLAPTPHLNDKHAVFGRVVEGIETVHSIGKVRTGAKDRPLQEVRMERVVVIETH
jgi:cyclophilin family peptidyl-prolyl cis-trans isomerase